MLILHLSDLHFGTNDNALSWYNQLAEDLHYSLHCSVLDALIITGDVANKATDQEYSSAKKFLDKLCSEFKLETNNIILVPGNHDVDWSITKEAYKPVRRSDLKNTISSDIQVYDPGSGNYIEACTEGKLYKKRFARFSSFYRSIKGRRYALEPGDQYELHPFKEQKLLVLGLNSAWQLDHFFPDRADIHNHALNQALFKMRENPEYKDYLKIAAWHHPINSSGNDRIKDHSFAERLSKVGFLIGLHGHVHKAESSLFRYEVGAQGSKMEIISAGTFGAPANELFTGVPWQYNFLKLESNKLTIETRYKRTSNAPWEPNAIWRYNNSDPKPRYEIVLPERILVRSQTRSIFKTREELYAYLEREAYNIEGYKIAVEAHIFDHKGRILLQERGIDCRDEVGNLEGIGGELRNEADLHEAVMGKVKKEIGEDVVIRIDHLLEVRPVRFIEKDKVYQDWFIISYLCRLIEGEPKSTNPRIVAALHFFTLDELYEIPDIELSRSTSRARTLYKARFGNQPYYKVMKVED